MNPQPQASPKAALPHVLHVDNDPTVRSLLVDYLGQNELRVTAVADGRSMEAVLAQQVGRPHRARAQAQAGRRHSARAKPEGQVCDPDHHAEEASRRGRPGDRAGARR